MLPGPCPAVHHRVHSCCGAEADCGPTFCRTTVFSLLLSTVVDVPCYAGCAVSQVVCNLGYADDMPVVGNNRCLELDSVVLQSSLARGSSTGAVIGQVCYARVVAITQERFLSEWLCVM